MIDLSVSPSGWRRVPSIARASVSVIAIGLAASSPATAQTRAAPAETALPSITVDKPAAASSRPAPKRIVRTGARATRPAAKPGPKAAATRPQTPAVAPVTATQSAGQSETRQGQGAGKPPIVQRLQLPQTAQSITAKQIEQTINVVDTEDALKYFPSLFVRKRNNGDTQPVLATRTWGVNSSARTLVYADDVLISALIANNNTIGAPRWGLVDPASIERLDFLYGPYAAAYPGNSIGGVLQITTRMPDHLEVNIKQNEGVQTFNQYGTNKALRSDQTSASIGDKIQNLSWFLSGSYLNNFSQPLAYVTSGSVPAGTSGAFFARNKTGAVADVVGAGGLLHSEIANINLKLAYDFTSTLRGAYTIGVYSNNTVSNVQSYLRGANGAPTFGGVASFASNQYNYDETHLANSVSLKSDTRGLFDFEVVASNYDFMRDVQRQPFGVTATGTGFTPNGKLSSLDGTNWSNADLRGILRPWSPNGPHEISFGLHGDQYNLHNPTYATSLWYQGASAGPLYTNGKGTTDTGALWAQDVWHVVKDWTLTTGGRLESWQAVNGFNLFTNQTSAGAVTGVTTQAQPKETAVRFSPKATLAWDPDPLWTLKTSFGEANRFPTVSELYQVTTVGSTSQIPNPNLRPEQSFNEEVAVERHWAEGTARITLFQENTNSALISQTNFLSGATPYTFFVNVDAIRNRGVEVYGRQDNVGVHGLELSGSVTYVDSRILSDPSFASTTGTVAIGHHVPYVPDVRATGVVTYRPDDHWAFTLGARYSGKQFSTLDNTDTVSHVFGAFDRFVVLDTRINYAVNGATSVSFGIDNLNNEKYFLFHPFPGRTFYADAHVRF